MRESTLESVDLSMSTWGTLERLGPLVDPISFAAGPGRGRNYWDVHATSADREWTAVQGRATAMASLDACR